MYADLKGRLIDYSRKVYEGFFRGGLEADQAAPVAQVISELSLSSDEYMDYLDGEGVRDYEAAQAEAAGAYYVFGVPLLYFAHEPFWGYDRIATPQERLTEAGLKRV